VAALFCLDWWTGSDLDRAAGNYRWRPSTHHFHQCSPAVKGSGTGPLISGSRGMPGTLSWHLLSSFFYTAF